MKINIDLHYDSDNSDSRNLEVEISIIQEKVYFKINKPERELVVSLAQLQFALSAAVIDASKEV
ncbi:hypothetical protein [Kosakonia radicincitans]|uniref:hypothetical protein n=1 Tax=Kosakonia radicincitans TaxID=283686 RepID=UPI001D083902|nr:hypothetical protein [Kosakonia radicincitans]